MARWLRKSTYIRKKSQFNFMLIFFKVENKGKIKKKKQLERMMTKIKWLLLNNGIIHSFFSLFISLYCSRDHILLGVDINEISSRNSGV